MFIIDNVIKDYCLYIKYIRDYRFHKNEFHNFFIEHRMQIDNALDDYYENYNNKEKIEKLFEKIPNLKIYLSLELIKNHYKELKNRYYISEELNKLGKCALCINKNILVIYDLDNNINYCYQINDEGLINYIKVGLQKTDKFISEIYIDEISLLQVIYYQIVNDEILSKEGNKKICKKISNELNRARMFDNYYIDASRNKYLPLNIDAEFTKLLEEYKNNQLTKEEYYIKYYYYLIISNQDVEKLYNNADNEYKEYIMKAYLELSSIGSKIHIRTASSIVNKEVLKRIKKTDTK